MIQEVSSVIKARVPASCSALWPGQIYDLCEAAWTSPRVQRFAEQSLVFFFLIALAVIELRRQGFIPAQLEGLIPTKHFYAIQVAFGALLLYEPEVIEVKKPWDRHRHPSCKHDGPALPSNGIDKV